MFLTFKPSCGLKWCWSVTCSYSNSWDEEERLYPCEEELTWLHSQRPLLDVYLRPGYFYSRSVTIEWIIYFMANITVDYLYAPSPCRAKLASLFGLDQEASQGNESFQYTAPKQPRKSSNSGETIRTETSVTSDSAMMWRLTCTCLLSVYSTGYPETSLSTWSSCSVICHSSPNLQIVRTLVFIF